MRQPVKSPRLRVMPLTITMAALLLGIKMNDLYRDGMHLREMLGLSDAYAEDEAAKEEAAGEEKATEGEAATEENAAKEEGGEAAEDKEEAKAEEAADGEETAGATDEEKAEEVREEAKSGAYTDKPAIIDESKEKKEGTDGVELANLDHDPKVDGTKKEGRKREFSQIELDLLQSLSARREELETWKKDIELKETLLGSTEQRLNDKLSEMKLLKEEVQVLLDQYNEHENTKIKSLVKIYENMKPKDAAAIFEELDMPVLLMVVDQMSERKVAPVLAQMSPEKAMRVTTELAELRKLNKLPRSVSSGENTTPPAAN